MTKTKTTPKAPAIDDGMQTITPHLVCDGAANAIEFYKRAFGATETMRLAGEGGTLMHAAVKIFGAPVMLTDENPKWGNKSPKTLKGTPVTIHIMVPNVDEVVDKAVGAGAKLVMPVEDTFWGDRYGIVEDPFGHRWSVATPIRKMTAEEVAEAAAKMFGG
jgi:PhnB protein